jgi:hypothetical protein
MSGTAYTGDGDEAGTAEAWRCTGPCQRLIFNLDAMGRPTSGAPGAHFISERFPRVCSVCYDLHWTAQSSAYFRQLAEADKS